MKKIKTLAEILGILIFAYISNCQTFTDSNVPLAEANNNFAMRFYSELAKSEKGNLFFSPFSIFCAFGMVYEGANNRTAEEIRNVFYFPIDEKKRLDGFLSFYNRMNEKRSSCVMKLANAYWLQNDFCLLQSYSKMIEKYHRAESYQVDFIKMPKVALNKINRWAERKTEGKIKKFLNEGDIDSGTRLVLTNAIYFKGRWLIQFDKNETKPDDFWLDKKKSVKVQMMQLIDKEFPYAETEDFQIIKLPYECQNLSILILLPKDTILPVEIISKNLDEYQKLMRKQKVDVFLPRLKVELTIDLLQVLKNLGINSAFNPQLADFSKMTGNKDLFISKAIQKSYLEVNEEGSEAAAVTGVVMKITAVKPETKKVFRADHPFLFFIIEEDSNLVLFAGKISNP